jgi:hypothetical protein
MDVETIQDIRQLLGYLRAAEFKAGVLHHDVVASNEKRKVAQDIAEQIEEKLVALTTHRTTHDYNNTPAANARAWSTHQRQPGTRH